jgi:hypothetical protein
MFHHKIPVALQPDQDAVSSTVSNESELEEKIRKILKGELEPDDETAVNLLLQQVALANKLPGSTFDLLDQFLRRNEPSRRTIQPNTRFLKQILTNTISRDKKERSSKDSDSNDSKHRRHRQKETQCQHNTEKNRHKDTEHIHKYKHKREGTQLQFSKSRKRSRSPSPTEIHEDSRHKRQRTEIATLCEKSPPPYDSFHSDIQQSTEPQEKSSTSGLESTSKANDAEEEEVLMRRLMNVQKRGRGSVGSSVMDRIFSAFNSDNDDDGGGGGRVISPDVSIVDTSASSSSTKSEHKKKDKKKRKIDEKN